MDNSKGYIYFRNHYSYDKYNVYKMGIASNIPERDSQYSTGEIERGYFEIVFEVSLKQMRTIERLLQYTFKHFNIKLNGGIEFYKKEIINYIEPYLNSIPNLNYKKLTKDEINLLIRTYRIKKIFQKYKKEFYKIDDYICDNDCSCNFNNFIDINKNIRDYQRIIINDTLISLNKYNRAYISLATGGGKTFISFNIFNQLDIQNIIIFTPRINICKQNINEKYIKILSKSHNIYDKNNVDKINEYDNNIICCCINSYKKIIKIIKEKNLKNIIIWYDEAHYGIEKWIIDFNNYDKNFILSDNNFIKYRLFTSASPNKEHVIINNSMFGDFINPFKVRYLINEGYLCNLNVKIYKEEINNDICIISFVNLIIDNLRYKKCGLCFCNSCDNALELFKYHLELYENDNTIPKPFLLLNSNKIKEYYEKYILSSNIDPELLKLEGFENDGEFNRIAYIVNMYSMGYDNPKIDFLFFKDPKMSHKDIIQSI